MNLTICPHCGYKYYRSAIASTLYNCPECKKDVYPITSGPMDTTFVPIDCNHNVDVKFINGEYVSVCTYCGKIFDVKKGLMQTG